ncbi:MAG: WYL domain-containing transcriptional regulator [Coriobacteriia bacterium]|nr:WYL domain-containing transcriptional regulator [Coriobacteriia bacterium]
MGTKDQKLKLLHLVQILEQETDDRHGLTGPQLIERLAQRGVEVERKTLYRDIACLVDFGYDIQKYQRNPVEYGLASRRFQDPELLLLADAVQSSRFLTERKASSLVKSIGQLGSRYQAEDLRKRVHVEGRIRSQNESVFYSVDAIQRAMAAKRKVEFRYFKLNEAKKRVLQHNGDVYCETPVQLVYMGDFYYLVVWNDKHQGFANYRVDRMQDIQVSEQPATKNQHIAQFNVAKYQERTFGMFNGESVSVTLLVKASAMSAVVDRFGKDVDCAPAGEGLARVRVTVMETPTFYGWLVQFGDQVTIEAPDSAREGFVQFLGNVLSAYEE